MTMFDSAIVIEGKACDIMAKVLDYGLEVS